MPDKWEYPWYAAWDLASHTIALAPIDPDFAKSQLILFLREWYMHPNGQIPAYEWAFGDVNPPVHAWAAWRVYKIDRRVTGVPDRDFLEKAFQKLLLNFTWWVTGKDTEVKNVFEGGFLGLDNIGVFDRSAPLPTGGHIEQSDGTSWMGMYCLNMLAIALELSQTNPAYEDIASKFFEHFVYIAKAMNDLGGEGITLWDEQDGFYYDVLHTDREARQLKVRSMVGLIPLFAVETLEPEVVERLPGFTRRMQWFINNRPEFRANLDMVTASGGGVRRLLSIVNRTQLTRVLRYMPDRDGFLSPYGLRALWRYHRPHPYVLTVDGVEHRVDYEPAESTTGFFGGNSNWRGPVWFPVNYLLIESLQKFHHFYGDDLKVECPSGSHRLLNLWDVAGEVARGLIRLFLRGRDGRRPGPGVAAPFQTAPDWRDAVLPGTAQVAAGYVMYGPAAQLVLTAGAGVHVFTLDRARGEFVLTQPGVRIPARGRTYSINEGNTAHWVPEVAGFVRHLKAIDVASGRPYTARYAGSLVADFHRMLLEGGVFLYPADAAGQGKLTSGKLRLQYEAAPIALVAEAAGGRASTGTRRILELEPASPHARVSLIVGSPEDVALAEDFYAQRR